MSDLYSTMSTLRAVRRLRTDAIPADVLHRVLQAACWAPTGGNTQPWRVVVVTDPDTKSALRMIYEPEWQRHSELAAARRASRPQAQRAKHARSRSAGDYLAAHLHQAPAILVFCANLPEMAITDADLDRVSIVGGASIYPAIQNTLLACAAEGLGCTLTTLHCFREQDVKDLLGIPDDWGTAALVPIGYPIGRGHGPITRQPPSTQAYLNHFGTAWPPQDPIN